MARNVRGDAFVVCLIGNNVEEWDEIEAPRDFEAGAIVKQCAAPMSPRRYTHNNITEGSILGYLFRAIGSKVPSTLYVVKIVDVCIISGCCVKVQGVSFDIFIIRARIERLRGPKIKINKS
jgi:hypothetical protein